MVGHRNSFRYASTNFIESFLGGDKEFHRRLGNILTSFRVDMVAERAERYAEDIIGQLELLQHYVGFVDCPKIEMCRSGGENENQSSCY